MKVSFILLFLLISNFSCKMNGRITSADSHSKSDKKGGILFLNFKIEQDSSQSIKITLTNDYWVSGSFKETERQLILEDDVLEFQFLDKNQEILKKILVANPLNASYESFSPNGTIERKKTSLKQLEFTVRANVSETVTYIRVNDSHRSIDLIKLK